MSPCERTDSSPPIPADRDWPFCRYFAWRRAHDRDGRLVAFEDKLAIKELARAAGVPTVPTVAVVDVETLDLQSDVLLPLDRFVLKTNHGCQDVVFVERTAPGTFRLSGRHVSGTYATHDANATVRQHFRWWLEEFRPQNEWALAEVAPRLLFAEPHLTLNDDYKVYVVGGRALLIHAMGGRWDPEGLYGGTFDRDWRLVCPITLGRRLRDPWALLRARFPRPPRLAHLLALAEAMVPARMSLMRVDFYRQPDDGFVLGEASVYPFAGWPAHSLGAELALGRMVWDELSARGFIAPSRRSDAF